MPRIDAVITGEIDDLPVPNIHEHVAAICAELELGEPRNVARLDITPTKVIAEIYELNADGAKFVDEETGEPSKTVRTIEVSA